MTHIQCEPGSWIWDGHSQQQVQVALSIEWVVRTKWTLETGESTATIQCANTETGRIQAETTETGFPFVHSMLFNGVCLCETNQMNSRVCVDLHGYQVPAPESRDPPPLKSQSQI